MDQPLTAPGTAAGLSELLPPELSLRRAELLPWLRLEGCCRCLYPGRRKSLELLLWLDALTEFKAESMGSRRGSKGPGRPSPRTKVSPGMHQAAVSAPERHGHAAVLGSPQHRGQTRPCHSPGIHQLPMVPPSASASPTSAVTMVSDWSSSSFSAALLMPHLPWALCGQGAPLDAKGHRQAEQKGRRCSPRGHTLHLTKGRGGTHMQSRRELCHQGQAMLPHPNAPLAPRATMSCPKSW